VLGAAARDGAALHPACGRRPGCANSQVVLRRYAGKW
jgi:hypothetical protein